MHKVMSKRIQKRKFMKKFLLCLLCLTAGACDNNSMQGRCLMKYGTATGIKQNSQIESERLVKMCSCFVNGKSDTPVFNLPITDVFFNSTCDADCTKLCNAEQEKRNKSKIENI